MSSYWPDKKITLTGGAGFLGSFVREELLRRGARHIAIPRSRDYDLTRPENCERLLADTRPDILIHLAAVCGGIGANMKQPGWFFYANAIMGIALLEAARRAGTQKVVIIGTICAYPKFTPVPFKEDDLWNGYPEETNAPYGLAKKMLLVQAQAYRQQYGCNFIYLLPVNLYGPRDNFDLETSHVIPALIRKMEDARTAGSDHITLWGTGAASREFLYAADAAEGICLAAEHYDGPDPVNLGASREITIRELAELVRAATGYEGKILWDSTKPDGQPRRALDTSRAEKLFGFRARTSLEDGIAATVRWWRETRR
jgi:GDP-L-fucose synthase